MPDFEKLMGKVFDFAERKIRNQSMATLIVLLGLLIIPMGFGTLRGGWAALAVLVVCVTGALVVFLSFRLSYKRLTQEYERQTQECPVRGSAGDAV